MGISDCLSKAAMKLQSAFWTATFSLLQAVYTSGAVLYVNLNSTNPTPPYADWKIAAKDIQDAIDASSDGDLILVTNGVYQTGGQVVYGLLTNRVVINKAVTVQSVNGPAVTVIQGNPVIGDSAVRCVYLTNNAMLVGFTLTNGATRAAGDSTTEECGGAVFGESDGQPLDYGSDGIFYPGSSTVAGCVIVGNSAYNSGAGAMQAMLINCQLIDNLSQTGDGGGADGAILNNCAMIGNSCANVGGGAANSMLNDCLLAGNSAVAAGGGAFDSTLTNCTVTGNSAGYAGGVDQSSALANCIVYYNTAPNSPNYVQNYYFPGTSLSYCCTTPDPGYGQNITNEPDFVNYAAGDYRLQSNSLCINTGNNGYVIGGTDLDGGRRIVGGTVDIGAYEYQALVPLSAYIQVSYTNVVVGFPLDFTGSFFGGIANSFVWNFGDGISVSNQISISHSWAVVGDYSVVLTPFNDDSSREVSAMVTVHVVPQVVDHYVSPTSVNPITPYLSWNTAATNIQDAIDAAIPGDQIVVTNGIYQIGGRVVYGSLTNRVVVDESLTVQSVNGPTVTIIQGYQTPGTIDDDNAVRCVYLADNAVLSGFTLTNGATRSSGDYYEEQSGGGAWCETAGAEILNCVLVGNSAAGDGGAGYQGTFDNCLLTDNSAAQGGGTSFCTLNNCTIVNNSGEGAFFGTLNNCIVYYNNPDNYFNSEYIPNTILNFCCTTPDPGGIGNITNEPLFVNLAGGDFHLQSNSPCINSGNNAYVTSTTDLDGNPRIVGGTVDIGAYEYQTPTSIISYAWLQQYGLPTDGSVDYADLDGTGI